MQYLSGLNLSKGVSDFIDFSDEITLFSAYLKLNELHRINTNLKIKRIVVRWEIQDLCLGVSDLELYQYCRDNKIALYRNTRIHLKVFWDNYTRIFYGSANVTNRGLGEGLNHNFELNGHNEKIGFSTVQYLNKIIINSEFVTEDLYLKIKQLINEVAEPEVIYPTLNTQRQESDFFLLSDLPMTKDLDQLFEIYLNPEGFESLVINCAAHDLVLYDISADLDHHSFYELLQKNFNQHPFVCAFKQYIRSEKSVHYGGVVKWIQENTTTVPTPRSWEVKKDQIVNILFEWVCFFDEKFNWSRPHHSQVIFFDGKGNV